MIIPVIEIVGECKKGIAITVRLQVGKEIEHPNTTEHQLFNLFTKKNQNKTAEAKNLSNDG